MSKESQSKNQNQNQKASVCDRTTYHTNKLIDKSLSNFNTFFSLIKLI